MCVMTASIDALDLPIQLFAVGTAIGMASALVHHNRTGEVNHWPVHVAIWALALFGFGLVFTAIEALT
jgi:hypothetical protein